MRLVEVALDAGSRRAELVDDADEIDDTWLDGVGTVGLTSGASVPEELVSQVLEHLAERDSRTSKSSSRRRRSLTFSLPKELRTPRR